MKKLLVIFLSLILSATTMFAQKAEQVDLGKATRAFTSTINALNSLYHDLNKQGKVDADINEKIRSLSAMAFPCREALINANMIIHALNKEKRINILVIANDIETMVKSIDKETTKETIFTTLCPMEKKMIILSKALGIKK